MLYFRFDLNQFLIYSSFTLNMTLNFSAAKSFSKLLNLIFSLQWYSTALLLLMKYVNILQHFLEGSLLSRLSWNMFVAESLCFKSCYLGGFHWSSSCYQDSEYSPASSRCQRSHLGQDAKTEGLLNPWILPKSHKLWHFTAALIFLLFLYLFCIMYCICKTDKLFAHYMVFIIYFPCSFLSYSEV